LNHILEYAGLFAAAFLSATVLPFQSEVVLFGLLVASVGNTLGSAANWVLGRLLAQFEDRRWFPVKRETIKRAEQWYHRYGRWSLLLSWLPFIGDPVTIVAGVLREPFLIFVAIVAVAKTARYFAVAAMTFGWF
jgi:membrane protein YqaA with SNARE-associated domain